MSQAWTKSIAVKDHQLDVTVSWHEKRTWGSMAIPPDGLVSRFFHEAIPKAVECMSHATSLKDGVRYARNTTGIATLRGRPRRAREI